MKKKRCNAPKLWQFSAGDKDKKIMFLKPTVSFGQGITSTFIQLIKAYYSTFNNDGKYGNA